MASASGYNHMRFARSVLKKSRKWEPSLVVQMYATHWRFADSITNFRYDGPMKPFLLALRAQAIPASLIPTLYDLQPPVSFIDGCLVVEIQDFRPTTSHTNPYQQTSTSTSQVSPTKPGPPVTEPVKTRVVMRPTSETLAETIELMIERKGDHWGDGAALDLEARILSATSPPLYLGTSLIAARAAALSLALTAPARPNLGADGTYRRGGPEGLGEDKGELDKLRKVLIVGDTMRKGGFHPSYATLRAKDTLANRAFFDPSRPGSRVGDANPGSVASSQHQTLPAGSPSSTDAGGGRAKKVEEERAPSKKKKKLTAEQLKAKKKRPGEELVDDKPAKKNATKKAKTAAQGMNQATVPAPFARQGNTSASMSAGLGNLQGTPAQGGWARTQ